MFHSQFLKQAQVWKQVVKILLVAMVLKNRNFTFTSRHDEFLKMRLLIGHEFGHGNTKCLSQLLDGLQRHVAFTTLHAADVRPVQPSQLCQTLLRNALAKADFPHDSSKPNIYRTCHLAPCIGTQAIDKECHFV